VIVARGVVLPTGLRPREELQHLPDPRAGWVDGPDLGPWLKRRKDARLLPRAAVLALPAAGVAMRGFSGDAEGLGLFVAVGREPPDEGDAEASLAAMAKAGQLDLDALRDAGRALYPPLLPLRTLPNMILAHVAIQHGIRGENACHAGEAEAGRHAWEAACDSLAEGRCAWALVGAAYSAVDLASARDRLRLGVEGPPGEGAIFALLSAPAPLPAADEAAWAARVGHLGPVGALCGLAIGG
jgi:hypothetical protein